MRNFCRSMFPKEKEIERKRHRERREKEYLESPKRVSYHIHILPY